MKDPIKVKAYNALYYANHKESEKQRTYSRRESNRSQYIAYMKKWHLANIDKGQASELLRKTNHPSYMNWKAMMNRCYHKNHRGYKAYGGRGICVYFPWLDFPTYEKEWGYSKPGPEYTVDRIDNDGDYEPDNVQWLTKRANTSKGSKNVSR